MNVLHISEADASGGAARAAYKLHDGLRELGHASHMLVGRRTTSDPDVRGIKRNAGWRALDRAGGSLGAAAGYQYAFYPSSWGVSRDPWFRAADVVQLHNPHGSYFSIAALPHLSRRRPVVWLLHDMWGLTGHVGYSYGCERWRLGCGSCPFLEEYPRLDRETSARNWRLKRRAYARSRLRLVAPSRWLAGLARAHPALGRFETTVIPYAVDTAHFAPGDREGARARLGLPLDRRVVLFAASRLDEPRKGLHLLDDALGRLADPPLLALAGEGSVSLRSEAHHLGALDDAGLPDAYRAADVTVLPTVADNFPNVAIESLASGTPCAGFDTGGLPDAIRDGETGYLARPGDAADLALAIERTVADRDRLGAAGRRLAETEWRLDIQARRYAELYAEAVA